MPRGLPSLRSKLNHGKLIGVVTLTDYTLHARRDFYCGEWDTPECRQRYTELLLQWQTSRRWPLINVPAGMTVAELVQRYWRWAQAYYSAGEVGAIKSAWQVLVDHAGQLPAAMIGPVKMRAIRERMIAKGWNRGNINKQIHRLGAIFKWAASNELLPVTVYQGLKTLEPLKRGRCRAPESRVVRPVAADLVAAVKPYMSRQVWAIVQLQQLTGARPGELLRLRKADIHQSGGVWRLELQDHKTAHHGNDRTLYFGPQAQAVLLPWLSRPDESYLFSPREAENERIQAGTQQRISVGGNVARGRRRKDLGEHYTRDSYRRSIQRACDAAFPPPGDMARGEEESVTAWRLRLADRWKELRAWQKRHRWHPHQLRHSAATEIRRRFGLEAAAVVLGHSSARVTDAVYAERDQGRIEEVMRAIG